MKLKAMMAAVAHDVWAHWMRYMFTTGMQDRHDHILVENDIVRWQRQMETAFPALSEAEQKSDYEIAARYIAPLIRVVLSEAIVRINAKMDNTTQPLPFDGYGHAVEILRAMKDEITTP